jgi:hypothetical protein
MSETNPIKTVFDFQRTVLESSQRMTHNTIEAQQTAMQAFVDSMAAMEEITEQNASMSQDAVHSYFDAVEEMMPEESSVDFAELREMTDEQFEMYGEVSDETWSAVHEALDEANGTFEEASSEYIDAVDDQFDAYLEVHEEVEDTTVEMAEEMESTAEEIDVSAP